MASMKNILTLMLMSVFILTLIAGNVSAFEFDNVKNYNPISNEITFKNSFLGIPTGDIATAKLDTPQIYYVNAGNDVKVAEFTINLYDTEYKEFATAMEFYNLKDNNAKIEKEFNYKLRKISYEDNYKTVCIDSGEKYTNGTIIQLCNQVKDGVKEVISWEKLDTLDLIKGKVTIGIFTDVKPYEYIEWIPTFFGVKVTEWASYYGINYQIWTNDHQTSGAWAKPGGMKFTVGNTNLTIFNVTTDDAASYSTIYLKTGDKSTALVTVSRDASQVTALNYNLTANTDYWLWSSSDGNHQYGGNGTATTFPKNSGNITWILGHNPTNDGDDTSNSGYDFLGITVGFLSIGTPLSITTALSSPVNIYNTTDTTITFSANATAINGNVTNMTLYIWNGVTRTNVTTGLTGAFNTSSWSMGGLTDAVYTWNVKSCAVNATGSECAFNTNRTLRVDTIAPIINITYPLNNLLSPNRNISLNFSASDSGVGVGTVWYNIDYGTNTTITANTTFVSSVGNHTIYLYANDTLNNIAVTSANFTIVNISLSQDYNANVIEGTSQSYINYYNLTNSGVTISNVTFVHNGTSYSGSTNNGTATSKTITIPSPAYDGLSSTWYYSYNLSWNGNSIIANSTAKTFTVNQFMLALCNATVAQIALNITFKDESTDSKMNATLDATTWIYLANGSSVSAKTYLFSNLSHNYEYDFCIYPNYTTLDADLNIQYSHSGDATYPQRQWQEVDYSLTNSTVSKTLYLLGSASGQYVTFQIINSAMTPIQSATVKAYRTIGGASTLIETKVTDASGAATMWLNPSYQHTIVVSKTGYLTSTQTITPSLTSYTITLQETSIVNATNYNEGINYSISPIDNYLNQSTFYVFNFTLSTSGTLAIDRFWYNITNSSGSIFASNYSANSGGTISSNISTGTNKTFIMYAYYVINGTLLSTSKSWLITDLSEANWSIKNFVTDLKAYTAQEPFGLNQFTITFLVFIIIFLGAGLMSYNFGLYSPAAVSGIIFGETMLFDAFLGLIQYPFGVTLPIATIVTGLVFFGLAAKEATGY